MNDFNEKIRYEDEIKDNKEHNHRNERKKNVSEDNYIDDDNLNDLLNAIMRRLDHVENQEKRTR